MNKILKKLFSAVLIIGLLAGCAGSKPAATEEPKPDNAAAQTETADPISARVNGLMEEMELKDKVEQLLVLSIQTYNGQPFTELNEEASAFLSSHKIGGMILFSSNCESIDQTVTLNRSLQEAAMNEGGIPLFLAIDQEGGYVTHLSYGTVTPGNMALGASGKPGLAQSSAGIIASELSALGFNIDFAPSLDINSNPANPIIGLRSFSDDGLLVSSLGEGFIRGLKDGGIIPCVKHYPGHGDTDTDSHTGLPVVNSTREELETGALVPFQKAASIPCDMVMTAHICFPNVETSTYTSILDGQEVTLPATLSHVMVQEILRDEIGYEGVVTTDSLQMEAIKDHFDRKDAAALALNAGVDILLMPVVIENSDGFLDVDAYVSDIVELVPEVIPEERIDEAVRRVLTLKANSGVLDTDLSSDIETLKANAEELVGGYPNHTSERAIADQTVTVLKNDNGLLPMNGGGTILFAAPQQVECDALRFGYERLMGEVNLAFFARYVNYSYGREVNQVLQELPNVSAVVITSWLDNMSQFDPNESIMIPSIQSVIQACHNQGIPCIVISAGLPYDLSCYEEADALLAVYNPLGASYDETGRILPGYAPNLPAAIDILFGYAKPSGTLPVNVPKVEGTGLSEEIAYPRGSGLIW